MTTFPYVHIYCPCADSPIDFKKDEPISNFLDIPGDIIDTLDQRMSFSLHPLPNLYFCEECYAIRCPRCVQEETISQFCPNCLLEVPKSSIYSDGNRKELESLEKEHSYSNKNPNSYALECPYCQWTSAEINIIFEKPSGLNGKQVLYFCFIFISITYTAQMKGSLAEISRKKLFYSKLRAHYEETYGNLKLHTNNHSGISKMMDIYERIKKKYALKNKKEVDIFNFDENSRDLEDDQEIIKKMAEMKNLNEIATIKQRLNQLYHVIFKNDLKPIPYLLRAKRSKRCRSCKSVLISPESKPMSAKFRVKLIAMNYIPTISLECFPGPISNCSPGKLSPNVTNLFLLTVTNPLCQKIKVFLATPQRTSGKYSHSVTILCPEFEVGTNKDTSDNNSTIKSIPKDTTKMPISGALWDRGRNWTTVVLEIIPSKIISNNMNFNDDLVEISVFVKVVYDIILDKEEFKHVETSLSQGIVSKEIGFWGVIGLGKIL
ncbi:hypothetical protein T552_00120 [Pneumocystis carinii B80]|uniref:Dynactin subunit 4 n=1 Tax=Pneumocystis carinii (strain B80) TaxID=1408658 RepID=A0A0W4ZSY7_PNEC8|nr:hypothetical protein T552_00120 [Pneumocystis carinii B80]KTW31477.1 hypothetical protein T552_00120 [Pneumocystis carinii B80]